MSFYLITVDEQVLRNQSIIKLYVPLLKHFRKKIKLSIGDLVAMSSNHSGATIIGSKYLGVFRLSSFLGTKAIHIKRIPVEVGTNYVATFEPINPTSPPYVKIKDVLKDKELTGKIDPTMRINNKTPSVISLSQEEFEGIFKTSNTDIEKLQATLGSVGKLLQKKLGTNWIYDIGTRKLHNRALFIVKNVQEDTISNYLREKLVTDPDSADKYYDLIESFADENIMTLHWNNFEKRVTRLASKMGFKATKSQKTNDGGVDVFVEDLNLFTRGKYIIQCKRSVKPVGVNDVKNLDSTIGTQNALKGILISASGFSRQALEYAEKTKNRIELLTWSNLIDYLRSNT